MKTLVYAGPGKVQVQEKPFPELKPGQVRIKVHYCGICGSDIGIFSGKHPRAKAPLVLGHEFIGIIEETAEDSKNIKTGDRIAPYPLLSCGERFACANGIPHVCSTLKLIGIDVDGGIAEFVCCDENVLFKLDDGITDKAAAVIEPLAVIIRTMHQADFQMLNTAAVIGAGPIGVLTGIVLKHAGASRIIISDVDQQRLNICKEFGLETVNVQDQNLEEYIEQQTDGAGVDTVFECSGSAQAAAQMTKICRIGGRICLTGVHKEPHAVNLQDVNFKEQTLVGSRVYTKREFGQAVKYAEMICSDLEKVVTHIVDLKDADTVFDLIGDPKQSTLKVLVDCSMKNEG